MFPHLNLVHVGVGVDFHDVQIVETVHEHRVPPELLAESVAQIVGRVGGDDEDLVALLSELDGEAAGGSGFADAALATDEDPLQGVLFDDVLGEEEGRGARGAEGGRRVRRVRREKGDVGVLLIVDAYC